MPYLLIVKCTNIGGLSYFYLQYSYLEIFPAKLILMQTLNYESHMSRSEKAKTAVICMLKHIYLYLCYFPLNFHSKSFIHERKLFPFYFKKSGMNHLFNISPAQHEILYHMWHMFRRNTPWFLSQLFTASELSLCWKTDKPRH